MKNNHATPAACPQFAALRLNARGRWWCGWKVSRLSLGEAVVFASVVGLLCTLPLKEAIRFGGDEGSSLMKALLVHRGYSLYSQIWDDQPPLYTHILSGVFSVSGESALVPRLISVLATATCATVLFRFVILLGGELLGAIVTVLLLLGIPAWTQLGVSAMQSVPMLALALLGANFAAHSRGKSSAPYLLLLAGALSAAAVQVKLTGVFPVLATFVALVAEGISVGRRFFNILSEMRAFFIGFLLCTIIIVFSVGFGPIYDILGFHLQFITGAASNIPAIMSPPTSYHLSKFTFLYHWDLFVGGLIGAVYLLWRRPKGFLDWYCLASLIAQSGFALLCRPWWDMYMAGFSVPLLLLSGLFIGKFAKHQLVGRETGHSITDRAVNILFVGAVIVLLVGINVTRLAGSMADLDNRARVTSDQIMAALKKNSSGCNWLLTQSPAYAFQAGVLVPPEYAVMSLKRVWGGGQPVSLTASVIMKYNPDLILIGPDYIQVIAPYIRNSYNLISHDPTQWLYKRKSTVKGR